MSGAELQYELSQIESGESIGIINYTDSSRVNSVLGSPVVKAICELSKGVLPEASSLDTEHTDAYVARDINAFGRKKLVVALEDIHDGRAQLDIAPMAPEALNDVDLLRGTVHFALQESGVRLALLDPQSTSFDPTMIEQAGFNADQSGMYAIAA